MANVQSCVLEEKDGIQYFRMNGKVLMVASEKYFYDLRDKAPFLQILPCPFCGVKEDKNHNAHKHIDTHLKTIIL